MEPYHSIKTLWKRDPETKYRTLIEGEWASPVFEALKDIRWNMYEKVDGTNVRVIYYPDEFGGEVSFAGRKDLKDKAGDSLAPQFHQGLWNALYNLFDYKFFVDNFDLDKSGDSMITLYGEGFGEKIQKGGGNYGAPSFCLFDIKIGSMWMEQEFVTEIARLGNIERAPLMFAGGNLELAIEIVRDGFYSSWGDFEAEGLIVRPPVELQDRLGNRVIGKIKTRDFR